MFVWNVIVEDVGYIGQVYERNEELARLAALSKFSEEGNRSCKTKETKLIFEDDSFSVQRG